MSAPWEIMTEMIGELRVESVARGNEIIRLRRDLAASQAEAAHFEGVARTTGERLIAVRAKLDRVELLVDDADLNDRETGFYMDLKEILDS